MAGHLRGSLSRLPKPGCFRAATDGKIRGVKKRRIIAALAVVLAGLFLLFDVDFVLDVSGSRESRIADPAIEAQYEACYAARDDEIHATAFGTIDNPDVQKEYITSNRARAAAECRALHPESIMTVVEPARFNLVDLAPRFW